MSTVDAPELLSALPDLGQATTGSLQVPPTFDVLFTDAGIDRMLRVAELMAGSRSMVPQHLHGNVGDCFAIVLQAMRWRMDPFAVAQKTFVIKGVLGYEAQLVNAVLVNSGAITGRPNYEWFGNWDAIAGRFKEMPAKNPGEVRIVKDWSLEEEAGLGIRISATCTGESTPRVLPLLLSQAGVRNSPLWGQDPKQQLAYLAVKRWARLHTPDVLLGVYTRDELEGSSERDMGQADEVPREQQPTAATRTDSVRNRLAAKRAPGPARNAGPAAGNAADAPPTADAIIKAIEAATTKQQLADAIAPYVHIADEADKERISAAYRAKVQAEKERGKRSTEKAGSADKPPPAEAASAQAADADGQTRLLPFSYAEIAEMINVAATLEALEQAADLINGVQDAKQRDELTALFRTQRTALEG
jgi:hypothetical protein